MDKYKTEMRGKIMALDICIRIRDVYKPPLNLYLGKHKLLLVQTTKIAQVIICMIKFLLSSQ